jgi:hypothetical protein
VRSGPGGSRRPGAGNFWAGPVGLRFALVGGMNTTCDHMAYDDGFAFCDVGREFPFECRCCAAWGKDADPTLERDRIWHVIVVGPVQAQADASVTLEPGSGKRA